MLYLLQYGEIEEMNVCDNLGDHLVGNVYIKVWPTICLLPGCHIVYSIYLWPIKFYFFIAVSTWGGRRESCQRFEQSLVWQSAYLCWAQPRHWFSWGMLSSVWSWWMYQIWVLQFHALEANFKRIAAIFIQSSRQEHWGWKDSKPKSDSSQEEKISITKRWWRQKTSIKISSSSLNDCLECARQFYSV